MIAKLMVRLIRIYQYLLSPALGQNCRFYPSCSHYAADSLAAYGVFKGAWLAAKRLLKCHPFHPGGYDPVPEPDSFPQQCSRQSR